MCSKDCATLWFEATHIKSPSYQVWWPCGSRSITNLVFYVTLQEHVMEGSGDFIEGSSFLYIPSLPSSVAIGIVVVHI